MAINWDQSDRDDPAYRPLTREQREEAERERIIKESGEVAVMTIRLILAEAEKRDFDPETFFEFVRDSHDDRAFLTAWAEHWAGRRAAANDTFRDALLAMFGAVTMRQALGYDPMPDPPPRK